MTTPFSEVTPATGALYSRQLRRLTHRSRSVWVSIMAVLLIVVAVWAGVELVLSMLGREPLLVSPGGALAAIEDWSAQSDAILIGSAIAALVVGLILLTAALGRGRRARHTLASERLAVVADSRVLAAAAARAARIESGVDRGQVTASLGAKSVDVRIRPSSGFRVDEAAVRTAVEGELAAAGARPLRVSVHVDQNGKVGA
ncbi:MAG: hypothetical protein ACTJHU_10455 [Mycetocola sp.]